LPDPRAHSNAQRYSLLEILVIALCATLAGATTFVEMAQFGNAKLDWLRDRLGLELEFGVPSHDTFGKLFAALDPEAFAKCFRIWTEDLQRATKGEVIAVDGKTLRCSFDSATGQAALHMVSAWSNSNRVVLGQLAVWEKSNEIKAVPALLKLLDLRAAVVTVDALNCQKGTAEQILQQGGDYLFALKDNHPWLCEDVAAYFHWTQARVAKGANPKELYASQFSKTDYGHGRREIRRCWCVAADNGDFPEALSQWSGLRSIIMVERERAESHTTPETGTMWDEPSREISYYVSSLEPDAKRIAGAVRDHWGIENSLHWVLDMAFDEDHCRVRKDNAGINMVTLRHLALNLVRQEKSKRVGIKIKMHIAGWNDDYMLKLLAGPAAHQ
jgi:predicted transposase YbfD/YdcC